jgi:hypothetical protein
MLLDPALELMPFQQYPALAAAAFDPDVSAQSHDLPLVAAAGVLLLEAHHIPKAHLHLLTVECPTAG